MLILVFIPLLVVVSAWAYQDYQTLNTPSFLLINHLQLGPDWLWANITFMGDTLPCYLLLVFFCRRDARLLWLGLVAVVLGGFAIQLAKHLLEVPRPLSVLGLEQIHLIGRPLRLNSFPSGHSVTTFLMAGLLVRRYLAGTTLWHRLGAWSLVGMASLIAWSRVKVGAHWPGDVVMGGLIGWYCAALVLWCSGAINFGRIWATA